MVVKDRPLADRVEEFVSSRLMENPESSLLEIDAAACQAMRGLLTPDVELIQECLRSYGKQNLGNEKWRLRSEDAPEVREQDLVAMRKSLIKMGTDLGYAVSGQNPVFWMDPDGKFPDEAAYIFYLTGSAMLAQYLYNNPYPPPKSLLVYPGGRSNLVVYKLRHDARLRQAFNQGWRLIKFRLLRRLAENPLISRENFEEQLVLDPATEDAPQMRLL